MNKEKVEEMIRDIERGFRGEELLYGDWIEIIRKWISEINQN